MGAWVRRALLAGALALVASAAAAQSAFCAGWAAGWEAAYRNRNMIPAVAPVCPIPPIGGDSFEVGYERGMLAALARIQRGGY